MRVGLIIYGSINTITGGFIYDKKLVEYLQSQGVIIKIFSQKQKNFFGLIHNNFSRKLIKEIVDFSPDILLEDAMNFISLFLLNKKLKKIDNFSIISIVHLLQSSTQQNFLSKLLIKKIEHHYLKSVTGFIFNSFSTEKSVLAMIGKNNNSLVAYPGKDRLEYNKHNKNYFNYKTNKLMIVFVGNLAYNKGLHILLHALAKIDNNLWQLSIIGSLDFDLKYSKRIVSMINYLKLLNNVKIFGLLNIENLTKILLSHHVLVVPSYYESYGLVYAEAMGAGLPVIASQTGGAQEIVDDTINGFLVTPGDSAMLRACVNKLIMDRELLKKMSLSSFITYRNLPSWDETMATVYSFLQRNYRNCTK